MASADIASLPVPPLQGERLLKHTVAFRYSAFGGLMGTLSLTDRRLVLRDGFIWFIGPRIRAFDLSEITVGNSDIPWYLKLNAWLGGIWWIDATGTRLYFFDGWFAGRGWLSAIRKAQSKLNK